MPRKKPEPKPKVELNWQEKPEWRRKVDVVTNLKAKGFTEDAIANLSDVPAIEIKRIIEDEETTRAIAKKNYGNQIPMMKEIIGMGLEAMSRQIKDLLLDDGLRKMVLLRASDMAAFNRVIQDLSMLVRLEEGKTTQNIGVGIGVTKSYEKTREAIQQLKEVDPVFTYPELPAPEPQSGQ